MEKYRADLKGLYAARENIDQDIQKFTDLYIEALDGKRGIFISDHAIVRWLERIRKIDLIGETDTERLYNLKRDIKELRERMLTLEEDRTILKGRKRFFLKDNYTMVIRGLTVVTILEKNS